MRIHIRGQMGVQILQSFVAISKLHDDEKPIIVLNTANLKYDGTEKRTQVFNVKCEIRHQDEIRKTPYWEHGAAELAMASRERVLRDWLLPKPELITPKLLNVLHCRGGDKSVASAESYKILANETRLKIDLVVSNDTVLGETIATHIGADFNPQSTAIDDWAMILNAAAVVAAPSAFISSTLMIDPNKIIYFAGPRLCDGPYESTSGDLLFIEEMQQYCPKVKLIK